MHVGGRALRELRRFPDHIFRPQNPQKRLAAGLCPDPLGQLERSLRPPSTVGAMEGNMLAVVWALCGEEGDGGMYVGRGGNE